MRKAAVSIPAKVAEGYKRRSRADKVRLLNIAQGSVEDSCYYLILSEDLGYGETSALSALLESVSKLLERYIQGIEKAGRTRGSPTPRS